jgi:hypothetical protein
MAREAKITLPLNHQLVGKKVKNESGDLGEIVSVDADVACSYPIRVEFHGHLGYTHGYTADGYYSEYSEYSETSSECEFITLVEEVSTTVVFPPIEPLKEQIRWLCTNYGISPSEAIDIIRGK